MSAKERAAKPLDAHTYNHVVQDARVEINRSVKGESYWTINVYRKRARDAAKEAVAIDRFLARATRPRRKKKRVTIPTSSAAGGKGNLRS